MSITIDDEDEMRIYFILNQITAALQFFQHSEWKHPQKITQSFKKRVKELVDEIVKE